MTTRAATKTLLCLGMAPLAVAALSLCGEGPSIDAIGADVIWAGRIVAGPIASAVDG